jgi:hypothetical protein
MTRRTNQTLWLAISEEARLFFSIQTGEFLGY